MTISTILKAKVELISTNSTNSTNSTIFISVSYITEVQQKVFDIIKEKLTKELILVYPHWNKLFKLYIDTLDIRLKAILTQDDNNEKERVIVYEAKTLNWNEQNYLTTEKEYLAVM